MGGWVAVGRLGAVVGRAGWEGVWVLVGWLGRVVGCREGWLFVRGLVGWMVGSWFPE
jgi:hypothetical protein